MPQLKMPYWMWMQNPLAGSCPQRVFSYKRIIYFLYKKPWQTVRFAYRETVRAALKSWCVVSWSFCTSLSCWAAQLVKAGADRGVVLGASPSLTAASPYADLRALWTSVLGTQHFTLEKLYLDRRRNSPPHLMEMYEIELQNLVHCWVLIDTNHDRSQKRFGCHQVCCQ